MGWVYRQRRWKIAFINLKAIIDDLYHIGEVNEMAKLKDSRKIYRGEETEPAE